VRTYRVFEKNNDSTLIFYFHLIINLFFRLFLNDSILFLNFKIFYLIFKFFKNNLVDFHFLEDLI